MCQYSVFYGEYENKNKTRQKNLTFPEPHIFEEVPAHNLNFEGDQINRAHGS